MSAAGGPYRRYPSGYMARPVTPPPERPTSRFTYSPSAPVVGEEVVFDGSPSTGVIDTYEWLDPLTNDQAEGVLASFTFASAGAKPILLAVTGPGGRHQGGQNVPVAEA